MDIHIGKRRRGKVGKGNCLEIVVLVGERSVDGGLGIGIKLSSVLLGKVNFRGSKGRGSDEVEGGVSDGTKEKKK